MEAHEYKHKRIVEEEIENMNTKFWSDLTFVVCGEDRVKREQKINERIHNEASKQLKILKEKYKDQGR